MTAPERIWAQRGTLIGDHAENGYWEARNLYSHTMAEYIRADLHEAEIARLTADRDAALVSAKAQHRSFPEAGDGRPMPPMGDDLMTAGLSADDARFVAIQLAKNGLMLVSALEPQPITVQDAARVPEIKALIEAVGKCIRARNLYEATPSDRGGAWGKKGRANNDWRIAFAGLDAALRAIAERDAK